MEPISYLSSTDINLTIPLNIDGVPVNVLSVKYRVVDGNTNELVAKTTVSAFVANSSDVSITIPASINNITAPETREIRVVEIYLNDGAGNVKIEYIYFIELEAILIEGVNSFQSYPKSLMNSLTVQNLPGWDSSEKQDRINALIEARRNLASLPLRNYYDVFSANKINSSFIFRDITLLNQAQYLALPKELKEALCRAQIIQADYLLAKDEDDAQREKGVIEIAVGEAKKIFKNSKPYHSLIHKRALVELSRWIISGIRTSR